MLRAVDPHEAYRRVELDAQVAGSRGADLTRPCFREVDTALGQALWSGQYSECRRSSCRTSEDSSTRLVQPSPE